MNVAEYVNAQLGICGKSQKEIAEEVGFPKANILTMIKNGSTKIPIPRAAALAKAMGVDQARFVRMVMKEYQPEVLEALEDSLGLMVTDDEAAMVEIVRNTASKPFRKGDVAQEKRLKAFAESL